METYKSKYVSKLTRSGRNCVPDRARLINNIRASGVPRTLYTWLSLFSIFPSIKTTLQSVHKVNRIVYNCVRYKLNGCNKLRGAGVKGGICSCLHAQASVVNQALSALGAGCRGRLAVRLSAAMPGHVVALFGGLECIPDGSLSAYTRARFGREIERRKHVDISGTAKHSKRLGNDCSLGDLDANGRRKLVRNATRLEDLFASVRFNPCLGNPGSV